MRSPTVSVVGFGRPRGPAHERLHAGEQFGEGERLGQVIVAAGLEAVHSIVNRSACAQNQDRRRTPAPPELVDDRQSVALRQHQIDDGDVVGRIERQREPLFAVFGVIDGKARFLQPAADEVGDRLVVFDDERAHLIATYQLLIADCKLLIEMSNLQ